VKFFVTIIIPRAAPRLFPSEIFFNTYIYVYELRGYAFNRCTPPTQSLLRRPRHRYYRGISPMFPRGFTRGVCPISPVEIKSFRKWTKSIYGACAHAERLPVNLQRPMVQSDFLFEADSGQHRHGEQSPLREREKGRGTPEGVRARLVSFHALREG